MLTQQAQPLYDPTVVLAKIGPRKTGEVALKLFFKITEEWGLKREEQRILLGSPGMSTLFKWQKVGGELPKDTLERISYVSGIATALQILLPAEQVKGWVKRPNRVFGGQPPLQRMLGGNVADLAAVRAYLDAERGW